MLRLAGTLPPFLEYPTAKATSCPSFRLKDEESLVNTLLPSSEVCATERTNTCRDVKDPHTVILEQCCFLQSIDILYSRNNGK